MHFKRMHSSSFHIRTFSQVIYSSNEWIKKNTQLTFSSVNVEQSALYSLVSRLTGRSNAEPHRLCRLRNRCRDLRPHGVLIVLNILSVMDYTTVTVTAIHLPLPWIDSYIYIYIYVCTDDVSINFTKISFIKNAWMENKKIRNRKEMYAENVIQKKRTSILIERLRFQCVLD